MDILQIFDIFKNVLWGSMLLYSNGKKILELSNKHKIIRYSLTVILFPVGMAIIFYFLYQFHKHPDFMLWTKDKPVQKKLDEYF